MAEPAVHLARPSPPHPSASDQLGRRLLDVSTGTVREVPFAIMGAAHGLGGMSYERSETIDGDLTDFPVGIPPEAQVLCFQQGSKTVVAALSEALIMVRSRLSRTTVQVVGHDRQTVDRVVEEAVARLEQAVIQPAASAVRLRVWWNDRLPSSISRTVDSNSWPDIERGYAPQTRAQVTAVMARRVISADDGRLLLWHGEPGTGKTTAVRTLAREWNSWCDVHYVSDPEQLFAVPGYLLTVAGDLDGSTEDERWRLVVAEDCDEYLRSDAKHRAGASLGRLLNLTDGILGNGLRVLVLLTTNEEIGRLHPAITRAGRCLSQIRFDPFTRDQAQAWLGSSYEVTADSMTLAELHALRANRDAASPESAGGAGGYL